MAPRTKQQQDALRIFTAERAAKRILATTERETRAVLSIQRDELAALATDLLSVCRIAEQQHLEKASAGSLAPEAFGGPVE